MADVLVSNTLGLVKTSIFLLPLTLLYDCKSRPLSPARSATTTPTLIRLCHAPHYSDEAGALNPGFTSI
jgi:hypothetical protein